jgi:hypothetical protein
VNRIRLGNAVDKQLAEQLRELSKETRIPQSKLLDEALELLFFKYSQGTKNNK